MLLLLGTTDKIQVITSAAGKVDMHASYIDYDPAQAVNDRTIPGRSNAAPVTAVTTDLVLAPGAGKTRNVKTLHISNAHATVSNTVTVQHTDGTTIVELEKLTLLPGENLSYVEGQGFEIFDANGMQKMNANAAVFTKRLPASVANLTITAAKITGLDMAAAIGTYIFEYFILYESSVVTTGVKLGVNHTGTVTDFAYNVRGVSADTVATATQTAIMDQDVLTLTAGLMESWAARAKSTSAPIISAGVDTINVATLMIIEGIMIVTADGILELYHASETANSTSIRLGSALRLTKIT